MQKLVLIGIAGAAGTLARYWLTGIILRHSKAAFPYGTLLVNLLGCLVMGLVMQLVVQSRSLNPDTRAVLVVGFLGAFTTFSAFGFETLELLRAGALRSAAMSVLGNVAGGLTAVWIGSMLGKALEA